MIPQSFIDDIQTRTDIVEVISSYIPLKRAGRNFKTTCPFHAEKTPSFMVSPQKQIFHCFGCQEGGGVIQFLMLYEKLSFIEAVEVLAKRLGIEIPHQKTEKDKFKSILYDVVNEASLFFNKNLLDDKNAKPVLEYLNKRGVDLETIKKFRIGYAWGRNSLLDYMRKKGFTLQVLEKASLVISQEQGYRDLFRERITFPIFDVRSRIIGFGARICKDVENAPKYINSLESPVYSKRNNLFGLNFSKEDVLRKDAIIIVEGYLDMIVPFVAGISNIVASLGTSFTLEQIQLIRRYTNNVILVFDSDRAGELATLRALDLLLENDLKVKIVKLPSGLDPDSLVRNNGKDSFLKLLEESVDFFDYKTKILKNMYDIESIEGKTKAVQEMFSTIHKLNSEIEKYEYIKKLSTSVAVKEEILIAEFKKVFSKNSNIDRHPSHILDTKEPLSITEKVLIKFMLTNNKAFSLIRKNFTEEDFTSILARKTISYLLKNYTENIELTSSTLIGKIEDKEISSFVSRILMDDEPPLDKEIFRDSMLKLRRKKTKTLKEKLRQEIKEAETKGDKNRLKILISKYTSISSEERNV
ncbi:MAG: DNA primase [Candidatus Omnitrophota bacterium]|nr:DNA primase [Candidatus Omnitrophota bacterium]